METVNTSAAPAAVGPYSQAIIAGGFVYCSGQIPLDSQTGAFVSNDIRTQTQQVLKNLGAVLEAAGCNASHVVQTTIFLKSMDTFADMNEEYARFFGEFKPSRATVEVARLPKDALVEISCVAYKPRA